MKEELILNLLNLSNNYNLIGIKEGEVLYILSFQMEEDYILDYQG